MNCGSPLYLEPSFVDIAGFSVLIIGISSYGFYKNIIEF